MSYLWLYFSSAFRTCLWINILINIITIVLNITHHFHPALRGGRCYTIVSSDGFYYSSPGHNNTLNSRISILLHGTEYFQQLNNLPTDWTPLSVSWAGSRAAWEQRGDAQALTDVLIIYCVFAWRSDPGNDALTKLKIFSTRLMDYRPESASDSLTERPTVWVGRVESLLLWVWLRTWGEARQRECAAPAHRVKT